MSSRSIVSNSLGWLLAAFVALAVVAVPRAAEARRRLVVLEFTGPRAGAFQEDLEKLLKKRNSLVPRKKWDDTADKLNATKINEKNVKKVAAKLQVDGVISGKVEKRGSRYYLHLQLREGKTGKTVAAPDIVERSAGIGADGRDTINNELLPIIDDLEPPGDDEDDEDEAADGDDEDEDDGRVGKGRSGFGKGKAAKGKGKVVDEDEDEEEEDEDAEEGEEDEEPVAKGKGKGKTKVAAKGKGKAKAKVVDEDEDEDDEESAGDDEDGERVADADAEDLDMGGDDGDDEDAAIGGVVNLTDPRRRAMDVAVGMSFTGRKLSFTTNLTMNRPQGYDGGPVPGLIIAADIYPLAFNRKNKGFKRNLGVSVVFDRVIKITSNLEKMNMVYDLPTTEQHYALGVVYRQPIGAAMQLEGSIRYNRRKFAIDGSNPALAPGDVDIPSTSYTYVDPGVALKYSMSPKMVLSGDGRFLLITDTGAMQNPNQYGGATVTGLDLEAGVEYGFAPKIMLRVAARITTIGFAFKGNGALTNNRDGDATTTDVSGARDTYFGGFASGVYLF